MPACKKKEQKQLSTLEANESRLVTKCRWVIEVTNSFLKNSFKALDNVKNKSLNHTLEDYRIAAALINKYFERLYSDNDDVEIAKRMKSKLFKKNNLEEYVKQNKLHKKSLYERMDGLSISDFPKLSKEEIISYITFGTYQLRQSLSYLAEHMKEDRFDIMVAKERLDFEGGKLLSAHIHSRHKNAVLYKCYIKYLPLIAGANSIDEWYCTCATGNKTVGCCVHLASIIYYLSCLKYKSSIIKPADELTNFFDPLIKESDDDDESNDDPDDCIQKDNKESKKSTKKNVKDDLYESDDEYLEDFSESIDETSSKLKRSLSITISEDKKLKPSYSLFEINEECLDEHCNQNLCILEFKKRIPPWGGEIQYNNSKIKLTNTCSFDYFIFSIWVANMLSSNIQTSDSFLSLNEKLKTMISLIQSNKWNDAKYKWLIEICNLQPNQQGSQTLDCFGSVNEYFSKHLRFFQKYSFNRCHNKCKPSSSSDSIIFFMSDKQVFCSFYSRELTCYVCNEKYQEHSRFLMTPPFLIIEVDYKSKIRVDMLPIDLNFNNHAYRFLSCNFKSSSRHFKAIFYLNNKFFLVDDLNNKIMSEIIPRHTVNVCFYYLI